MHKSIVKYSLLSLFVLCFSAFSADTSSTTNNSASQTTTTAAGTNSAAGSSTQSTTSQTTSATTGASTASSAEDESGAGKVTINFVNSSDLVLTKASTTTADSCWGSDAPDTIAANKSVTITTNNCTKNDASSPLVYEAPTGERFTLSWGQPTLSTRSFAVNSTSDQYQLKSVENDEEDDDTVTVNYFLTASTTPTNFSIVVGSDPQAWRLVDDNDPNDNQGPWEAYMNRVITGINGFLKYGAKFVIINGDLTEFGRDSQRESYDSVFGRLSVNYYWGLGNHDYANNVGDCRDWPNLSFNACAREAVDSMRSAVSNYYTNMLPEVTFDWKNYAGSLAYAWTYGNIRFIQLQNYPTYDTWLDHWSNPVRDINPSLDFLEVELNRAKEMGQIVIVNMHDYSDHFRSKSTGAQRHRFKYLLNNYKVLAVFGGHTHQAGVFNRNGGDSFFGRVPVFNSGALFKGDWMAVDFKANNCMVLSARNSENGGYDVVTWYGTLCMSDVEKNATGNVRILSDNVTTNTQNTTIQGTTTQGTTTLNTTIPATTTQQDTTSTGTTSQDTGTTTGTGSTTQDTGTGMTTQEQYPDSIQIATRGNDSLCLAATAGQNATLTDCSKPETFFNLEERTGGYNKLVSVTDSSLCLKTSSADNAITLASCTGNNSTGDLTSTRLWLLPNFEQGYLLLNKSRKDQCVQAAGESAQAVEITACNTAEPASSLASQQWIVKRDNIVLQPAEDEGE